MILSTAQPRTPISVRWLAGVGLLALALVAAVGWLAIVKTEGRATLGATAGLRREQGADLTSTLTRNGYASAGTEVDVILATPTFFNLTSRSQEAAGLGADAALVFVANENVHYGDLPKRFAP